MSASDTQQTILVNTYDPSSEGTREHSYVTIGNVENSSQLSKLREEILLEKVLPDLPIHKTPFCTATGAEVSDKLTLETYYKILSHGPKNETEPVASKSVYFKKARSKDNKPNMEGMDQFLKDKLDLKMTDKEVKLEPLQLKQLMSSYAEKNFMAKVGTVTSNPATMSESNWDVVMRTNGLLYASKMIPQVPKEYTKTSDKGQNQALGSTNGPTSKESWVSILMEQAKRPALAIKPRALSDLELDDSSPNVELPQADGKGGDSEAKKITMRIPRFQVMDESSVEVFETKNRLSSALAEQAFSRTEIEASMGGGAFNTTAGAKAGFSTEDRKSFEFAAESQLEEMHITYNFPRVVVHLDDDDLELTKECKVALDELKKISERVDNEQKSMLQAKDVFNFCDLFGQTFPTRVELGGRLYSCRESSSFAAKTKEQKSQAMKAAASLSFSSPWVQASASASHEKSSESTSEVESSSLNNMISWHARGGDTTLCNNPPAWCSTVGAFQNWRVMKQENFRPLMDIIGQNKEYRALVSRISQL